MARNNSGVLGNFIGTIGPGWVMQQDVFSNAPGMSVTLLIIDSFKMAHHQIPICIIMTFSVNQWYDIGLTPGCV
jgi:hypothetical protein